MENEKKISKDNDIDFGAMIVGIALILLAALGCILSSGVLVGYCVGGLIMAFICKEVAENRVMDEGTAFVWGGLLGIIGLIIVLFSERKSTVDYKDKMLKAISHKPENNLDQLFKLAELKEKGLINEDEYNKQKSKLLEHQ